nr:MULTISPECIES: LysM peptidoglycan-binding domain-containing M23 family metallopeptidase [unclassified Roseivivax]
MAEIDTRYGAAWRAGQAGLLVLALAACEGPMDFDLRPTAANTSDAALNAVGDRPAADARGVISYPTYQVAVARRGDTLSDVATRVGLPAGELARYNGIEVGDVLREGEIVALPRRVTEPSASTGAVDITALASNAIDNAPATPVPSGTVAPAPGGVEPVRHQVSRGETAYSIARLYNVTPRALADWNGLDQNYSVREGQYLLIPVATGTASAAGTQVAANVTAPGSGSPTPTPPSAAEPLPPAPVTDGTALPPASGETSAQAPAPATPAPDVGEVSEPPASQGAFRMPVSGTIIREYAPGSNDGIDIAAPAGTTVSAAASGTVAAITTNTDGIPILVIKHPDNILTVYTHIDNISVAKGDAVSRGQSIANVRAGDPARMHFEVRDGFDAVDPNLYLN